MVVVWSHQGGCGVVVWSLQGGCGVVVWSLQGGRTALVRVNMTFHAQIYRDELLQHHVVPLINVTDGTFQHDIIIHVSLWPTRPAYLSPIEHIWGHSGSQGSLKEPYTTNTTGTVLELNEWRNAPFGIVLPPCVVVRNEKDTTNRGHLDTLWLIHFK